MRDKPEVVINRRKRKSKELGLSKLLLVKNFFKTYSQGEVTNLVNKKLSLKTINKIHTAVSNKI